jgi:hypothetical protein
VVLGSHKNSRWRKFDTARYLVNMSPSLTLADMTPNEVWSGKNPLVAHLKVLVVIHLCMFPRKRGAGWTRRKSNVFSLDIKME